MPIASTPPTPMDATYVNRQLANGDATFKVNNTVQQAATSSDATFVTKPVQEQPDDNQSLMTEDNSHEEQEASPVPVVAVAPSVTGSKKKKELFK